ncbi:MAG: phosphoglycerate kinase [Deltaproteobacteria bacterium]|nr:phosphoglycerate kinase [Deltaproteobacteria bacterium]MBI3295132.1 phosphoglycerate kinase [Deltaproteobacteria bacterium]
MAKYPLLQDLDLKGRRVFVRVDFNVPLKDASVTDKNRIEAALPTIQYILEQGGRCILGSHLGRPEGQRNPKYSLEPVGSALSELLNKDVVLADDCVGDGPRTLAQRLRPGEVMLLENLRFHKGEEENSTEFIQKLNELTDVYVSDAFGTLHRAHASTAGLARIAPYAGIGLLVQKELQYLEPLRENPPRPFMLVMGGAKVFDKIALIDHFLDKIDALVIGGAMAYAFLKSGNSPIGKSLCDDKQVALAGRILKSIAVRNIRLILPLDHVIAASMTATETKTTVDVNIPEGMAAFDIGPKTVAAIETALEKIETVFWNGPMGVFEQPAFAKGTFELARIIGASGAKKLAGGGDVAAAIGQSGSGDKFDFISTGGGATLEYLEGKNLPGLKALEILERGVQ